MNMFNFPPYPGWDGLHPIIIHFPVALLLVAPVFVLGGIIWKKLRTGLFIAALATMVMGTIGTYIAVSTGKAAAQLADHTAEMNTILTQHAVMAEKVRLLFTILTCAWAVVMIALHFGRAKFSPRTGVVLPLILVACYLPAMTMMVGVAHAGGRLVHSFGIHAMLPAEPAVNHSSGQASSHERHHEN